MERFINVAGAQTGPIARNESRQQVVSRLLELMREAKARGSDIVVFPELALTTFFPRWWMEDDAEIDSFFEREMPSAATRPLFETAQSLGIGFYLGYAELAKENGATHRYNTAILVDKNAAIVGKYRKVHLPGHADNRAHYPFQHLEKRYFEPGDLGFPVFHTTIGRIGMAICYDGWFPETYRLTALQGADIVCVPTNWVPIPGQAEGRQAMANILAMAAAHSNSLFIACADRVGVERGQPFEGQSLIVSYTGWPVAGPASRDSEEIILAEIDLGEARRKRNWNAFNQVLRDRRADVYNEMLGSGAKPCWY